MKASNGNGFERNYALLVQSVKLKGLQPKTIEAYSRAIRRIGSRFEGRIDTLSEQQLTDYFTELVASHSWSTVKLDLYGLKFYCAHVLRKPWVAPGLIKPPKSQRLPDIPLVQGSGADPVHLLRGGDEDRANAGWGRSQRSAIRPACRPEPSDHVSEPPIGRSREIGARKLRGRIAEKRGESPRNCPTAERLRSGLPQRQA